MATKRKHVSKKRKGSWRKFCDISDVEEFLNSKHLQDRTGGDVSQKKDRDLFSIGSHDKDDTNTQGAGVGEEANNRKRHSNIKDIKLKCFSNLENTSSVKSPHLGSAKNIQKLLEKQDERWKRREERSRTSAKGAERQRQREAVKISKTKVRHNRRKGESVCYDLWGDQKAPGTGGGVPINGELKDGTVKTDRCREKPSILPAVEVAHPGASYNPSYEDHQALLYQAATEEDRKMKKERKVERWSKFDPSQIATSETWLNEMSTGLTDKTSIDDADDADDGNTDLVIYGPSVDRGKKKTKQMRNKQKAEILKEKMKKVEKLKRMREQQFNQLRSIKQSVKCEYDERQRNEAKLASRKVEEGSRTKRLGRKRFEEAEIAVSLAEDISGSLRTMKVEGSLLQDRFVSLQKRNLIEPRDRASILKGPKSKSFKKKRP